MHLRRLIIMLIAVASLSLGLSQAMSPAYAASNAPAKGVSAGTGQAGKIIPNIQFRECSNQSTTWVNLDMLSTSSPTLSDWCFGYTGTWHFGTSYYITNLCSGNNKGFLYYRVTGVTHILYFGPGQYHGFPSNTLPVSLTINGWSGSDRCVS